MNISKITRTILEHLLFPSRKVNKQVLNKTVSNKVILITGATYGIGEALAYMLATDGITLILAARTSDKLLYLKEDLERKGAVVHTYSANLQDMEQVESLLLYIQELSLSIDVFVNNAGKSICRTLSDSLDRFHDFTRTMSLNYYAPVKILLRIISDLQRNKGQIINVSSINVLMAPPPYWAAYQASKSAFDNWLRSCLPELRSKGIAVTSVYLPLVRTRMIEPTEAYRNVPAMAPQQAAQIICRCIIKRNRKYASWWVIFLQFASLILGRQWESMATFYEKRKNSS